MTDQPSAPTTPSLPRTVAVGSDHAGFGLKEEIAKHLVARGIEVVEDARFVLERGELGQVGFHGSECYQSARRRERRAPVLNHLEIANAYPGRLPEYDPGPRRRNNG